MAFMPEDVLNKNFTATQFRRGYDEHEVDDFLDEIVVELRRLSSENLDLNTRLTLCLEDKGVIPPEAKSKIAASRASAEKAEKEAQARIAKANAEAEQAESEALERKAAAAKAAEEAEQAAKDAAAEAASAAPAAVQDVEPAAVPEPAAASATGSAAGVLALAEKLHAEYVSEGQETRERLISEGQALHDQVVGDASAKEAELRSTAQTKHDALIAEATARHEQMITEARERSTGMVSEAQEKRAEVLQTLGHERSQLQKKIEDLKVFERDYRARLKAHLEGQLDRLERIGVDEMTGRKSNGKIEDARSLVDLNKSGDQADES
jgi:DivIVA domain-containing protein